MDLVPVVVDISSDDEADGFYSIKRLDVPYDSFEEEGNVINFVDLDQYINSKENSGPLRPKSGGARDDLDDECMILDGDPDKPVATGDDKRDVGDDGSDDLCIVGQKGQVACRDYPHSRHLCANFPFSTTSHVKYCNLCHCFVCDSPAPCIYWGNGVTFNDHCHATDKDEIWKARRKSFKKINTTTLPLQKLAVSEHPFPPIRNPQQIFHPNPPPPTPTPIQPRKATAIRPCTTASLVLPSSLYYHRQRPLQQQTPSESPRLVVHGKRVVNRGDVALTATSHTQFKRVAATGSSGMTHSLHTASSPSQMHRTVPQRSQLPPVTSRESQQRPVVLPRSQSMPVSSQRSVSTPLTTQKSQNTAVTSSEVDNIIEWQHILAGVAAELGVSDSISQSLMSAQPYTVTSSSPAFDIPIQCQMTPNQLMASPTDLGQPTISSNSIDFDPRWRHYFPEQNQGGNSQLAAVQSFNPLVSGNSDVVSGDIHLESFLAAVEESAPMPGKEVGLPEVDPASFLYDLDCSWNSIANV